MDIKLADAEGRKIGWTYEFYDLQEAQKGIENLTGERMGLEEIEAVLKFINYATLTAELTSAKEEIERLKGENEDLLNLVRKLQDNCLIHHERALAAESLLASERKETERLRGEVAKLKWQLQSEERNSQCEFKRANRAEAALQSRQGEE